MKDSAIRQLLDLIGSASHIAVLTGAGISTPSGIPDFRSQDGLYSDPQNVNVFDIGAFIREPRYFYDFARRFYPLVQDAEPGTAHQYLAQLEKQGKDVRIATQNIDDLHSRAGSQQVYHVHGNVETCTCMACGESFKSERFADDIVNGRIPHCGCGGVVKPDITFFGEMLPEEAWNSAEDAMRRADLVLVIGSSLVVYPAASLPRYRRFEAKLAIVNRDPTDMDLEADVVVRDDINEVFKELLS